MPEAGYLPIPSKLAKAGVKDMVRISDARMSGTAYGTIVLHVAPDTASGGPLGLVQDGDHIRLSVRKRELELLVNSAELDRRAETKALDSPAPRRGYARLYHEQISRPTKVATSLFWWTVRDREGASARHIVKSGRCLDYNYARQKGRG